MVEHEVAQAALDKAKIYLMTKPEAVFFTTACFSFIHEWDDSIETAQTNGTNTIIYSPDFFMSLTRDEQVFLILHETFHVVFLHSDRMAGRDPELWNVACDYVINLMLVDAGFTMPKVGLLDKQYAGMAVEAVYAKLLEDMPPPPPGGSDGEDEEDEESSSGGSGGQGNRIHNPMRDLAPPPPGGGSAAVDKRQADMADVLVRAKVHAETSGSGIGNIAGELEFFLSKLLKPKLPWNRILSKYMTSLSKSDYSFRKFNRRYLPEHYLPSLHDEALMEIVMAVDSSGSVTDSDFTQFISEAKKIIESLRPSKMTLIQFDYGIRSIDEIKSVNELLNLKFTGRGGTCVRELMKWTVENKPNVLLIFTDGYFHVPSDLPKKPMVWLIHNNPDFTCKTGKVIHYEV